MIIPGDRSYTIAGRAQLLGENEDRLQAWAERHVRAEPDLKWLLGNFIEAERPNSNGHIFPLESLRHGLPSIEYKALDMLHHDQYCIGTFAGGGLVDSKGNELTAKDSQVAEGSYPIMESLAAMWYKRFPDEFLAIRGAHAEGVLYYSHETVPETVQCPECDMTAAFDGLESDTYCSHMNGRTAPKIILEPTFVGGATVIPPARPGWSRAEMKTVAKMIAEHEDSAEQIYLSLEEELDHLAPAEWESMMTQILAYKVGTDG